VIVVVISTDPLASNLRRLTLVTTRQRSPVT
jgi:hypothetical protein